MRRDDSHSPRTADELERAFVEGAPLDAALREAALAMLQAHRREGQPVVVLRKGVIVELTGEALDQEIAALEQLVRPRRAA